jgi:hypothetical protein
MGAALNGSVVGVAPATPRGQESQSFSPEGGERGERPQGPTTRVDRGYVGTLDDEARSDLFELSVLLAYVARRAGMSPRDAAKSAGRARIGELLALTEVRRMRVSTLYTLADKWGVPREVMDDIAAACPAAIADETGEG